MMPWHYKAREPSITWLCYRYITSLHSKVMSAVKSNMGSEVSVLSRPWVAFYNIYSFSPRRKGEAWCFVWEFDCSVL